LSRPHHRHQLERLDNIITRNAARMVSTSSNGR
jgi:hypothetical protein